MGICYLIGAGECAKLPDFSPDDLVIAVDGGYDSLISQGKRPDILIGDLDSVKTAPSGIEILKFKVEKDETDMHLAFLEGQKRGFSDFLIFGGTGGRADHSFANYSLLLYAKERGANAKLISFAELVMLIKNESIELSGGTGRRFSVFAFGGDADGVTVTGAKYEAKNVKLTSDFPLGVSNSFLSDKATVEVKNGALLIFTEI